MSAFANERIPYFYFVTREHGEDREASEKMGYAVPKMVNFIYIIPHGNKGNTSEFFANDFIERKAREAKEGRYDPSWVKAYKEGYALFLDGKEIPRSGTPLINYERLLKSRREQLAARFPTVEDLAAVPDSDLQEIGMDGRVIRDLARLDLEAKKGLSPVVKELADANETIRRQNDQIAKLAERLDALEDGKPRKKTAVAA